MAKIPTFEARGRLTAEAGAVRTGIQVSPTATPAGGLSKVAKVAEDFGLGQIFDIAIPNQKKGIVPSKKWKKTT